VTGFTILENPSMNRREYPASPRKLLIYLTVLGGSHFNTSSTLAGSTEIPPFVMICPRKETSFS
jgi:hypothetical protein